MAGKAKQKGKNTKWDDTSPGMKVVAAYWLLLFGNRPYSLTELSKKLKCSKPTVLRVMDHLSTSGYAPVDEYLDDARRKWYKLSRPPKRPNLCLTAEDIQNLLLCRDLVWHLLPDELRSSVTQSLRHVTVLLPDFEDRSKLKDGLAKNKGKAAIDYGGKGQVMDCLLKAMQENLVCKITYTATDQKSKQHLVAPRFFETTGDSIYVQGRLLKDSKDYPNTLALHRIDSVGLTKDRFLGSASGTSGEHFGIMDGDPFEVRVLFRPAAAKYASERRWSRNQKLDQQPDGSVVLDFTSTSEEEVISAVLSFGPNAQLLEPAWLAEMIGDRLERMAADYKTVSD